MKQSMITPVPTPAAPQPPHSCPHCGSALSSVPVLTAKQKLEALADIATRIPSLFVVYETLPSVGGITAEESSHAMARYVDPVIVCTRLKKLHQRGLVRREGRGTAHHPYKWTRT